MKNKILLSIFALFLVSLFMISFVSAAPIMNVEVKGINQAYEPVSITAGETVPIKVSLRVIGDIDKVYARAEFDYGNAKITALTDAFDLLDNTTYILDARNGLYLGMPEDIAFSDENLLIKVQLEDKDGDIISSEGVALKKEFKVTLQRETNKIKIQNITMPEVFNAGEKTIITTTIKNLGTNAQSNLYAELIISRLGFLAKEDIGSLSEAGDDDDTQTFDMPLILDDFVESGDYTLELRVFNDDLSVSQIRTINIDGIRKEIKFTEVTPRDTVLEVEQNNRAIFRISILNLGTSTQTYDINLADNVKDWGTVQIEPSNIVLEANEKKVVEVFVSPNRETIGEQVFTATVKSDNNVVDEVKLVADVKEAALNWNTINPFVLALIIAAIIFVVIIAGMFGLRLSGEYKSRLKAMAQVSQARDIGREEAKQDAVNLMYSMMSEVINSKKSEKEDLTDKTAERALRIFHPLRGEEVNDVMTSAVNKLSEEEEEKSDKVDVRNHTLKIIDGVIAKLKEKDEVDDVVHDISRRINPQELGQEGTQKAIDSLENLKTKLNDEIEQIEEEEEVIKKKKKKSKKESKKKSKEKKKGKKAKKKSKKKKIKHIKGKSIAKRKTKKSRKKSKKKAKKRAKRKTRAKKEIIVSTKKEKEKPSLVEKVTTRTIEKY